MSRSAVAQACGLALLAASAAPAFSGEPQATTIERLGQQIVWWSAVALVRRGHTGLAALPALAFVAASAWAGRGGVMKLAGIGVLLGAVLDSVLGSYFAIAPGWALALSILAAAARGLSAPEVRDGARPDASHW